MTVPRRSPGHRPKLASTAAVMSSGVVCPVMPETPLQASGTARRPATRSARHALLLCDTEAHGWPRPPVRGVRGEPNEGRRAASPGRPVKVSVTAAGEGPPRGETAHRSRPGGRSPAPVVRGLSWNLWGRPGPWQQRRQAIEATLAEVRPDVCGLQEVWGGLRENLAAGLAERLGMHWCWADASKWRDSEGEELSIGNAILSRWP